MSRVIVRRPVPIVDFFPARKNARIVPESTPRVWPRAAAVSGLGCASGASMLLRERYSVGDSSGGKACRLRTVGTRSAGLDTGTSAPGRFAQRFFASRADRAVRRMQRHGEVARPHGLERAASAHARQGGLEGRGRNKKPHLQAGGGAAGERDGSGRNGFLLLDVSIGGGRPRGRGGLVLPLHVVGQLFLARFLGFARSLVHLVELVAHKHSFRIKRRAGLPCHALELSIHATPRAQEVQWEQIAKRPGPVNLCYRNRRFPLSHAMNANPIVAIRFVALAAGALFFGTAIAQGQAYPARTIRLVAATSPAGITDYLPRMSAAGLPAHLG